MKSEDDIPCSTRLGALVCITLIFILLCSTTQALEVRILDGGFLGGAQRGRLINAFHEAAVEINFIYGLSTHFTIDVVVYPSFHSFWQRGFPHWAGGGFLKGKIHLPPLSPSLHRDDLRRMVGHELFHAAVRNASINLPLWLEEGLAGYCFPVEFPEYEGKKNPPSDAPFTQLDHDHAMVFYRKATDVVTRLSNDVEGNAVNDFFTLLEYMSVEESFFHAFGIEMDEAWNKDFAAFTGEPERQ